MDLFDKWASCSSNQVQELVHFILDSLNIEDCPDDVSVNLTRACTYFDLTAKRFWKECHRNRGLVVKRHATWLNSDATLPEDLLELPDVLQISKHRGRPQLPFAEASAKTKRRRVEDLLKSRPTEELSYAAEVSGRLSSMKISENPTSLSPLRALALYFDLGLSERKYKLLRNVVNSVHPNTFPSLYAIREFKKIYIPTNKQITDTTAYVDLQELLNLTAESIVKIANIEESTSATLVCKWGFDGSSGHSLYKQRFFDPGKTDEYMFLIAFCPLKLIDNKGVECWKNPHPSSTIYCRPIKFMFIKENAQLIKDEETLMNKLINSLSQHLILKNTCKLEVSYRMLFTMIDGSVCNILSETNSTSKCFICGATPKEMNSETVSDRKPRQENYRFGLSTLHCWIRCFECLLHISYRLTLKTWQVRGTENKEKFEKRKKEIQDSFKTNLGLIVDKPKPGFGSTNDGNTARRFFANPALTAQITGLNEKLIENFSIILRVISTGKKINLESFQNLLIQTKNLYLELYHWYFMPSSVHKLLIHGTEIISFFDLPIGQLSEEALEASHKELRKYRLSNTRKTSRKNSNTDLLTVLILRSDPFISQHRHPVSKKSRNAEHEIKSYLSEAPSDQSSALSPYENFNVDDNSSDEEDSEEEIKL